MDAKRTGTGSDRSSASISLSMRGGSSYTAWGTVQTIREPAAMRSSDTIRMASDPADRGLRGASQISEEGKREHYQSLHHGGTTGRTRHLRRRAGQKPRRETRPGRTGRREAARASQQESDGSQRYHQPEHRAPPGTACLALHDVIPTHARQSGQAKANDREQLAGEAERFHAGKDDGQQPVEAAVAAMGIDERD